MPFLCLLLIFRKEWMSWDSYLEPGIVFGLLNSEVLNLLERWIKMPISVQVPRRSKFVSVVG